MFKNAVGAVGVMVLVFGTAILIAKLAVDFKPKSHDLVISVPTPSE
ncbi:hypothetical protein JNK62_03755 [bacterium]|nr:hypothetical protein [bacterium]